MEASQKLPVCRHCAKEFAPGATWRGANYCRALYLLPFIRGKPKSSAWELSQLAQLSYSDTTRAMLKLRDFRLVDYTTEEDGERIRYRYTIKEDQQAVDRFLSALDNATRDISYAW